MPSGCRTCWAGRGSAAGSSVPPRDLTDLGCAYAVQIQAADLSRALTALHRASLDPVQIFMTQQKGLYREVEP